MPGSPRFEVRIEMRSTPTHDPRRPDLVLLNSKGVSLLADSDLGRLVDRLATVDR